MIVKAGCIFAGIDGTGETDDATYAVSFANSFVKKLSTQWRSDLRFYNRGPAFWGTATKQLGNDAAAFVAERWKTVLAHSGTPFVFLAGYSRGGAAVIHASRELKKKGINVTCMLLYDPVDSTPTLALDVRTVPSNVVRCYRAYRAPETRSREDFNNCGLSADSPGVTKFVTFAPFRCTHSGMGGMPWLRNDSQTKLSNNFICEPGPSTRKASAQASAASRPLIAQLSYAEALATTATTVTPEDDARISQSAGAQMASCLLSSLPN